MKFRVWNKEEREFKENYLIDQKGNLVYEYSGNIYPSIDTINNLKIQYSTCCYDKNNQEIYEGDILIDSDKNLYQVIRDLIETGYGYFELPYIEGNELFKNTILLKEDFKVIGNIYNNPELIEQNNDNEI